eukprot:5736823-Pyramimonas_sp.AAC.1
MGPPSLFAPRGLCIGAAVIAKTGPRSPAGSWGPPGATRAPLGSREGSPRGLPTRGHAACPPA